MNQFFAEVIIATGQGGLGPHTRTGRGQAFGRSPKRALAAARRQAEHNLGEGGSWCVFYQQARVHLGTRLIYIGD